MNSHTSHSSENRETYWPVILLSLFVALSWIAQSVSPEASRMLFLLTVVAAAIPVISKAFKKACAGELFTIEMLMSVASAGALLIGASAEAAVVLWLFHIGENLEAYATRRAKKGITALMSLVPENAILILNGQRRQVSVDQLRPGDIIEAGPGTRLPADASLLNDRAAFDESALTGESLPVERTEGQRLAAGTLVVDRVCQFTVISEPGDSAIDRILRLIEEAEQRKAPTERFLDAFSRYYTPAIVLASLLVMLVPPLVYTQPWETWIYRGLALMLIGCPCALVISTPAAITSGLAAAARQGILIKGGAAMEQLAKIEYLALDKTGTLTEGRPEVISVQAAREGEESRVLQRAASVESGSGHPLAQAIVERADKQALVYPVATERQALPGMGVQGRVDGRLIQVLSPARAPYQDTFNWREYVAEREAQGQTVVLVCEDEQVTGLIALEDTLRSDAKETLQRLRAMGIDCVMLTGDNPGTARTIAHRLGVNFQAGLLPEDKVTLVYQLQRRGHTAMVGDGINDAPAMRAASMGIAMGGGTDVALETADAALTCNQMSGLPLMIDLARRTRRIILQNITVSLAMKAVFLLTSILGLTGLWLAILADSGATVLVTFNALRLLKMKPSLSAVTEKE